MTDSARPGEDAAPIDAEFEPTETNSRQNSLMRGPGWMPVGILLVVLALLSSYIVWTRGLPFHRSQTPVAEAPISGISELEAKVIALESELTQQTRMVSTTQQTLAEVSEQLSALRSSLGETQAQIARLDGRIADADTVDGSVTVPESLIERISALENMRPDPAGTVEQAQIDALSSDIAELRSEIRMAPDQSDERRLQQASLAMIAISAEAARGRPFVLGYQQLVIALPDNTLVKGLEPFAQQGVPTRTALQQDFAELKAETLSAASSADGIEPGWVDQLFGDNVRVTRTATTPLVETLERAAEQLEQGDLEATITQLDTIPDAQANRFAAWIGDAQDRIDLDQRLDSLRLLLVSLAQ